MNTPIAIVGMAGSFPGAVDVARFWANIVNGVSCLGEPPAGDLLHRVYDPEARAGHRVYAKRGGFLTQLPPFDPTRFKVMPRGIDGAEPEHFIALQAAADALADAGDDATPVNRDRTEVILGRGTFVNRGFMTAMQHAVVIDQTLDLLGQLLPDLDQEFRNTLEAELHRQLPPFSPETAPGLCHNVAAGIIANRLDLHGRNLVVDSACASCLLALETAVSDLRAGRCDCALVGGIQVSTHAPIHMIFAQLGAVSRTGRLRPFDREADGTMLGEGVGMVVLQRLADAEADGRRIYAVVRGVGSSSDGRGAGLLAPRLEGEILALERAYEDACVDPATVDLVEAHGTGIPLGDRTEIQAMAAVLGRNRCRPIAVGSVKSMIGHLIPAAGIAGLIKTALALHHRVLPPTLGCDQPHPDLNLGRRPFVINTRLRPWIHGEDTPRRAGVSAFGFGGINGHAVLEEYRPADGGRRLFPAVLAPAGDDELFVLSAADRETLLARTRELHHWLRHRDNVPLAGLAAGLAGRPLEPCRLTLVAGGREQLLAGLEIASRRLAEAGRRKIQDRKGIFYTDDPLARQGTVALLFPGEGSQYVNMLSDLACTFPSVREPFDLLDRAYQGSDPLPSTCIFPPPGKEAEAEKRLLAMEGAVDAVTTADRALFALLRQVGLQPAMIAGHSSGELAALAASGAVRLAGDDDILAFLRLGSEIIVSLRADHHIPEGRLLAVGAVDRQDIDQVLATSNGFLRLAMDNCPHQFVLCGEATAVAAAAQALRRRGGICQELPFRRAYHTERFQPAMARLAALYDRATFQPPAVPLYSCCTAGRLADDPRVVREASLAQWANPVRFRETVERMYADGARIFVEVGPRANLTGFVRDILKDHPHLAVATNVQRRPGRRQFLFALAQLLAHGVDLNVAALYGHRQLTPVTPETFSPPPAGITIRRDLPRLDLSGMPLRRKETGAPPTAPTPAPSAATPAATPTPAAPAANVTDPALAAYLATMEQFLALQERIFTGTAAPPAARGASPPGAPAEPRAPQVLPEQPQQPEQPEPPETPQQNEKTAAGGGKDPLARLLAIASERTGYPESMLHLDQDMEAELGIDSIKRVEILGALAKDLGLEDTQVPGLDSARTLRQVAAAVTAVTTVAAPPSPPAAPAEPRVPQVLTEQPQQPKQPEQSEKPAKTVPGGGGSPDPLARLLAITSERTGYPESMLHLDQDMEAELGIDSIKRVEILGALAKDLGLEDTQVPGLDSARTLRQVAAAVAGTEPAAAADTGPAVAAPPTVPLHPLFTAVERLDDHRYRGHVLLDPARYDFLAHHSLGGAVSRRDPDLHGLVTMPFFLGLELLAAGSAPLFPGRRCTGFTAVRALDWVIFHRPQRELVTLADKTGDTTARVRLLRAEDDAPVLEGTVHFGPEPDPQPAPPEPAWPAADAGELYPGRLFHGPALRTIAAMEQWAEEGAAARLQVPAPADTQRGFLVAPLLLDGAGQVVGAWATAFLPEPFVLFPAGLDRLEFTTGSSPAGGRCLVRCRVQASEVLSQVTVTGEEGPPWCTIHNLRHRRIPMPTALHRLRGHRDARLSTPLAWPAAGVVLRLVDCRPLALPDPDGGVLAQVLAHLVLGADERRQWDELVLPAPRRLQWLGGRLAVKEAAAELLAAAGQPPPWPADLEVVTDEHGAVRLATAGEKEIGISIAHADGRAVGLAGPGPGWGVDVEPCRPLPPEVRQQGFTSDEERLLDGLPARGDQVDWWLAAWCAKEAAAKAMGTGMAGGPRGLTVSAVDPAEAIITITAGDGRRTIRIHRFDDLLVAVAQP